MIDEKKVIEKLQTRIDDFVAKNPGQENCASVETIREFIHMLELEAFEQHPVGKIMTELKNKGHSKKKIESAVKDYLKNCMIMGDYSDMKNDVEWYLITGERSREWERMIKFNSGEKANE